MNAAKTAVRHEHDKIAGLQEFLQFPEMSMFDGLRVAMEHHHTGIFTVLERPLGDQLPREIVIVVT